MKQTLEEQLKIYREAFIALRDTPALMARCRDCVNSLTLGAPKCQHTIFLEEKCRAANELWMSEENKNEVKSSD